MYTRWGSFTQRHNMKRVQSANKKNLNCGHRHKRQERKVRRAQSIPFFLITMALFNQGARLNWKAFMQIHKSCAIVVCVVCTSLLCSRVTLLSPYYIHTCAFAHKKNVSSAKKQKFTEKGKKSNSWNMDIREMSAVMLRTKWFYFSPRHTHTPSRSHSFTLSTTRRI